MRGERNFIPFDVVTGRAVTNFLNFLSNTAPLLANHREAALMYIKGGDASAEFEAAAIRPFTSPIDVLLGTTNLCEQAVHTITGPQLWGWRHHGYGSKVNFPRPVRNKEKPSAPPVERRHFR